TTTTRATASCAVRQAASVGAVKASTSPVTVTTRASGPCSVTWRPTRGAGNSLLTAILKGKQRKTPTPRSRVLLDASERLRNFYPRFTGIFREIHGGV